MDIRVFYRIMPVKAPVRFARVESYPTYEQARIRLEEIIYALDTEKYPEMVTYKIERMKVSASTTLRKTVCTISWYQGFRNGKESL